MQRDGMAATTVAAVLSEAGLSTRAFYRHFASKDELLLAVYATESDAAAARLDARVAAAGAPRAALDAWITETLALAFSPRRAARTRTLLAEGRRLEASHPGEASRIVRSQLAPLERLLAAGRDAGVFPGARPVDDARSVYALTMALVADRLGEDEHRGRATASLGAARDHVLRLCLPALEQA
jgi:AcrR family transcriptional regulator